MIRSILSTLKLAIILISTALVGLGGVAVFDHYRTQAETDAGVGEAVVVTIKGDDVGDTAELLRKKGLIRSEQVFELTVRYVDRDIHPATYDLKKGMSVSTIVDLITREKSKAVTKVKKFKITVIEGWRTEQIAEELDNLKYPPGGEAFLRAVKDYPHENYDFLKGTKKGSLEGFLYPLTYEFTNETSPDELITMMLNEFDNAFSPNMRDRAEQMNLSIYDVVKIAALVEREVTVADERYLVADVYLKRFSEGNGWRLDADPAVQYVLGEPGDWWPVIKSSDVDSPYNLYQHEGLGPAPICSPQRDTMIAVLTAIETPFWFFTARLDGSDRHLFGVNNEDQNFNQSLVAEEADMSEYDSAYLEWVPTNDNIDD